MGNFLTENQDTSDKMDIQFHDLFPEDTENGLILNGTYFPHEIVIQILSHIHPKQILKCSLVCKKWCNIIKSHEYWFAIYSKHYADKPKLLPWYIYYGLFATEYFNKNLLKNNSGRNKFKNWKHYGGEKSFVIEKIPQGSDMYPTDEPDFENVHGCFVTTYFPMSKLQLIKLPKLIMYIVNRFKPHIYGSEWIAGRFDCGGSYTLMLKLYGLDYEFEEPPRRYMRNTLQENEAGILTSQKSEVKYKGGDMIKWRKVELLLTDYPDGVNGIIFAHEGQDNQFWAGHYGPKMTCGQLKILFDSIKEDPVEFNRQISN